MIRTSPVFIADKPEDQIGKLNSHMYSFETKIQHNEVSLAYIPPIDDRPRKKSTRTSKFYRTLFGLQYFIVFVTIGGFTAFMRWRNHVFGHNQRVYRVTDNDRFSYIPEYKWLVGLWKHDK